MKSLDEVFDKSELKYIFEAPNDNPEAVAAAEEEEPPAEAPPEGDPNAAPAEGEAPAPDAGGDAGGAPPADPFGGGDAAPEGEQPPAEGTEEEPTDADLMTLENKRDTIVQAMTDQWNLSVKMEGTPSYLRVDGILNDTQRAVVQAMAEEMGIDVKYENASMGNSKITKIFFTPVIVDPKKAAHNFIKMYSKGGPGPGAAPEAEASPFG